MQDIYDFMNGRDVSASFSDKTHNSDYSFGQFVAVQNEVDRILADRYIHSIDENGENIASINPDVSSELLDVSKVLENNPA